MTDRRPFLRTGLLLPACLAAFMTGTLAAKAEDAAPGPETTKDTTEAARPASREAYSTALVAQIRRSPLKISGLREAGLNGTFTTLVGFSTGSDGRLVSSRVMQSSGSTLFDDAAMAQIRAAAPFPLYPEEMDEDSYDFTINISSTINPPAAEVPESAAP